MDCIGLVAVKKIASDSITAININYPFENDFEGLKQLIVLIRFYHTGRSGYFQPRYIFKKWQLKK